MTQKTMRDAFWDRIYTLAQNDPDIVIVSADLGAPSLDKFRRDFPKQYINVGIAEQNAVLVATGLALAHKKPIAYAITQFITLRTYEQFRIYPCGMNLPVTLLGVGAGACYDESGPTHHSIEDLAVMRTLPRVEIYNASDAFMASKLADMAVNGIGPKFIRLDREIFDDIPCDRDFQMGFSDLKTVADITIVATGNMVHVAIGLAEELAAQGKKIGVIDVFKFPVDEAALVKKLQEANHIITLEEHSLRGGMGSYVLEILNDAAVQKHVRRLGFDTRQGYSHCYNYGGREAIRHDFGVGRNDLMTVIKKCYMDMRNGSN